MGLCYQQLVYIQISYIEITALHVPIFSFIQNYYTTKKTNQWIYSFFGIPISLKVKHQKFYRKNMCSSQHYHEEKWITISHQNNSSSFFFSNRNSDFHQNERKIVKIIQKTGIHSCKCGGYSKENVYLKQMLLGHSLAEASRAEWSKQIHYHNVSDHDQTEGSFDLNDLYNFHAILPIADRLS